MIGDAMIVEKWVLGKEYCVKVLCVSGLKKKSVYLLPVPNSVTSNDRAQNYLFNPLPLPCLRKQTSPTHTPRAARTVSLILAPTL